MALLDWFRQIGVKQNIRGVGGGTLVFVTRERERESERNLVFPFSTLHCQFVRTFVFGLVPAIAEYDVPQVWDRGRK